MSRRLPVASDAKRSTHRVDVGVTIRRKPLAIVETQAALLVAR